MINQTAPAEVRPVQLKGGAADTPSAAQAIANAGTSGLGGDLPFRATIQTLFGLHDVSRVRAHSDAAATEANAQLGSAAYATGDQIAFGDPIKYAEATYGTFDQAHAEMKKRNDALDAGIRKAHHGAPVSKGRYVLFAQLFWSNQSPDYDARKKPDPSAFLPDLKTGKLDMSNYTYEPRSMDDGSGRSFVNFDYGFWDDASHCFWHANHMKYRDPAQDARKPMKIYQSTKERFLAGYEDFDRVVFCIAMTERYDPRLAALAQHKGGR